MRQQYISILLRFRNEPSIYKAMSAVPLAWFLFCRVFLCAMTAGDCQSRGSRGRYAPCSLVENMPVCKSALDSSGCLQRQQGMPTHLCRYSGIRVSKWHKNWHKLKMDIKKPPILAGFKSYSIDELHLRIMILSVAVCDYITA